MAKAVSLQNKLLMNSMLSSILAGVLAWFILMGVSVYQAMQLHDEWMQNVSSQLLGEINQSNARLIDELSADYAIQYQLYYQQELFTHSARHELLQGFNSSTPFGFHYAWRDGQLLRIWSEQNDGLHSVVLQPVAERLDDLSEIALGFAALLIGIWVVQGLLLYWFIQRQLRPLRQISAAIAEKSAQDLSAIASPKPEVEELQPIVRQLNAMLARVERTLLAEQRFTADASHELRSPLSAMQMRLQVLKRKYQDQSHWSADLESLQLDITRGTQILENLLLLARLDPEQSHAFSQQHIELKPSIFKVIHELSQLAEDKALTWQVQLEEQQFFCFNPELWQICLRNFLDNAVRYTPSTGRIEIYSRSPDPAYIELYIENSGLGLAPEVLTRLGERFYRALGTQTQGSGLGLSISQKIIDLHAAKLDFKASKLGGLQVMIRLNTQTQPQ